MFNNTPKHQKIYFNDYTQFDTQKYIIPNMEDDICKEEFFKYYFTPTKYINVESLVDVDTVRIY